MANLMNASIPIFSSICAIVAAVVAVISVMQNKKNLIAQTIGLSRMKWIEEVRQLMYEFSVAYIKGEEESKRLKKLNIELYLRKSNSRYKVLEDALDVCSNKEYNEIDLKDFIEACQSVLNDVWLRTKQEAGITNIDEGKIKKVLDKIK